MGTGTSVVAPGHSSPTFDDDGAVVVAADGPGTGVQAPGAHGQARIPRAGATSRTAASGRSWTSSTARATRAIIVSAGGKLFSGPESSQ